MKTGNYTGYRDRGYKRNGPYNGDRLIDKGLVLRGSTDQTVPLPPIDPPPIDPPPDTLRYVVNNGVQVVDKNINVIDTFGVGR